LFEITAARSLEVIFYLIFLCRRDRVFYAGG
jgi:hypothetical protein